MGSIWVCAPKLCVLFYFPEPARFDYPLANVSSRRNDAVTLSCLAKGDDPINIVWSHNGSRIDLNNYRYGNGS